MITTPRVGAISLPKGFKPQTPALRFGQHTQTSVQKLISNPRHHYPTFLKALNQPVSKISQSDLVATIGALRTAEAHQTHRVADTQRIHHEMAEVLISHVHTPTNALQLQTTLLGSRSPVDRIQAIVHATARKSTDATTALISEPPILEDLLNPAKNKKWTQYIEWLRQHKGQNIRNNSLLETIPGIAKAIRTTWVAPMVHSGGTHFLLQEFNTLLSHVDNAPLAKKLLKDNEMKRLFQEKPEAVNPILKRYLTEYRH